MNGRRTLVLSLAIASIGLRALACASKHNDPPVGAAGPEGLDPDGATLGGGDPGDGSEDGAAGDGAPVTPPPPPSYCQGLTFYVTFDQGVAPTTGTASPRVIGEIASTPSGHFGGAAQFVHDASVDASMVFYDAVDGAAPFYAETEGTIAFWFRRSDVSPNTAFVRPLSNAQLLQPAGPAIADQGTSVGVFDNFATGPIAVLPLSGVRPFLRETDFDQFVAAWRAPTDAGPGVGEFVLNGGSGEIFSDAGYDAATLDGAVDDAGNYRLPYAVRRTGAFGAAYQAFVSMRVGGNQITAPHGDLDELAVWNRMLTRAEMSELYRATTPLRAACALP